MPSCLSPLDPGGPRAPTRVMLADDHRLLREGVRRALEEAEIKVVAEASDGQEAVRVAERTLPQVILMDVSMPVLDGIGATRAILARRPELAVIMLTMFTDPVTLAKVHQSGALGWLGKDCTGEEIVTAVRLAASGGSPNERHPTPAPGLATRGPAAAIPGWSTDGRRAPRALTEQSPAPTDSGLTAREREVLQLVAEGASTAQLAARLYISPRTVKNHLASIYAKLEARDRTEALVQAARRGIVSLR